MILVNPAHHIVEYAHQKTYVINALMVSNSKNLFLWVKLLVIALRFVVMEKDLSLIVMMVILETVMDVTNIVKSRNNITAKVDHQ